MTIPTNPEQRRAALREALDQAAANPQPSSITTEDLIGAGFDPDEIAQNALVGAKE